MIRALVNLNNDIIVPFYVPTETLSINYIYLNLYFPGLQAGDYPDNASKIYIRPLDRAQLSYKTGSFYDINEVYALDAGMYNVGADYWWERIFLRYLISSLRGFSLDKCELQYLIYKEVIAGGSNDSLQLAELADFGLVNKDIWGTAVNNDYGNILASGVTDGTEHDEDISVRIAILLAAGAEYVCYRFKGSREDDDPSKANFFQLGEPLIYAELSEDTNENVSIYYDDGAGYNLFGSYNTDQENLDLKACFSGTGKKLLKFTCPKMRRIDILVRLGLTINRI